MVYFNLFLIMAICVFIIDLSGFITSLKKLISWLLTGGKLVKIDYDLKPISCSYCMNFWIGLIYLICIGQLSILNIFFVLLMSTFTVPFMNLVNLIVWSINTFIAKLSRKL